MGGEGTERDAQAKDDVQAQVEDEETALATTRVGFIGFGSMAQAIAQGLLRAGMPGGHLRACARRWDKLVSAVGPLGGTPCRDAREVAEGSDVVFVAVKPATVEEAVAPAAQALAGKIVISVAWGVSFDEYERILAPGTAHLGAIPNIPVSVGEGAWVCEARHSLDGRQLALARALMGSCGIVVEVPEGLVGVAGTVTSCAPAFAAMFVEALADAGVKHGLARALAYQLAAQMIAGTGRLLEETGTLPAALKDAVCSPGGATIRGVAALEDAGLRSSLIKAMDAIC